MTMHMKQGKSCQDLSFNAEQLRKTAQQIHKASKNDLKSLNRGMSHLFSVRPDNRGANYLQPSLFRTPKNIPKVLCGKK